MLPLSAKFGLVQDYHESNSCSKDGITETLHPAISVDSWRYVPVQGPRYKDFSYNVVWKYCRPNFRPTSLLTWFIRRTLLIRRAAVLRSSVRLCQCGIVCNAQHMYDPDRATLREAFEKHWGLSPRARFLQGLWWKKTKPSGFFDALEWGRTAVDLRSIHLWHQCGHDSRYTTTAESIKVSKAANMTTAFVRCDISFIHLLTSMITFGQAFGAKYHVSF